MFWPFKRMQRLPKPQKISLIVPCAAKHAHLLPKLIQTQRKQSRSADEVIISLSEADQVPHKLLDSLDATLVLSSEKLYAGENRNRACEAATGDLLITQDADDTPHLQRNEIIEHYFQTTECVHLLHTWLPDTAFASEVDQNQLREVTKTAKNLYQNFNDIGREWLWTRGRLLSLHLPHNGNIALRKEVFQHVKWPDIHYYEDYQFNRKVIAAFRRSLFIDVPLVTYNFQLSATPILI